MRGWNVRCELLTLVTDCKVNKLRNHSSMASKCYNYTMAL
jgi:hypothetical protein